jgi:hypothetical protein
MFEEYLFQWATTNVIALGLLFLAWKYPRFGKYIFGLIFLAASIVNALTAIQGPSLYLQYKQFVILEIYERFIGGYFVGHIVQFVLGIAAFQLLISIGLLYGRFLLKPALIGGMIFMIGIAPLGLGSALPAPIILLMSLWVLFTNGTNKDHNALVT